jgi:hypothetical protein
MKIISLDAERQKLNRAIAIKTLATLTALITGIAVTIFLATHLLTFGVSLMIASAFLFCYHYNQYTFLNGLYNRVSGVVEERMAAIKSQL